MSNIHPAASVLLARAWGSREVFVVARAPTLRFLGGFLAFPGGKVHAHDDELARCTSGLTGQHIAAVRELFEETGVLLARKETGAYPRHQELVPLRRQLLTEQITFGNLLLEHKFHLRSEDLKLATSLLTPPFAPFRFDTAFFVAILPPGQTAEVWPGELTEGSWRTAEQVLADWNAGDILVSPPTVALLQTIYGRPVEEWADQLALARNASEEPNPLSLARNASDGFRRSPSEALRARDDPSPECQRRADTERQRRAGDGPIWFSPGVQMIPLFCEGLPPSTHTNAYLVGSDAAYLIDPGASNAEEQNRLCDLLTGRRLRGVVLTHHHPDHVGAANVCAKRYGVPIFAHPLTAQALHGRIEVHQFLNDGDRLDLGAAPDGKDAWHLQAIHTPGHAPGHLSFWEPRYRLLFVGDMVSMLSSVLIPLPPEGDLAAYLQSLQRLVSYPARLLLPAHGSPSARATFVLEQALAHRRQREEQLLQALQAGSRTISELAQELYRGLPAELMRFAEMQIQAGLHKLQREGQAVTADGTRWQLLRGPA